MTTNGSGLVVCVTWWRNTRADLPSRPGEYMVYEPGFDRNPVVIATYSTARKQFEDRFGNKVLAEAWTDVPQYPGDPRHE